jgi:hypothetical protein
MKFILYSFIFLFCTSLSFGQVIKAYSGKYEKGTATYQYYENENYERILHGSFSYKESEFQITGQYNNNLRNGFWKATTSLQRGWGKGASMITQLVTATYNNGKLEGLCTYKKMNATIKTILATSTANFKNNMLVGSYKFDSYFDKYENNSKFSIDCSFTKDGFLDGIFKIDYNYDGVEYQDIQKYRYGFLFWSLCRNQSNGEILKKYDKRKFIDQFYSNYDSSKKVSIIPYSEFGYYDDPIYLSGINASIIDRPDKLGERKNVAISNLEDTVFYKNAPFTFIRTEIRFSDYETTSSYWNLQSGLNFWNNCENCNNGNPLYRFHNGIFPISFLPVKQLVLDDEMYKEILLKSPTN